MRIHLNIAHPTTRYDVLRTAAKLAGVGFDRYTKYGSRSHDCAYDVILSGESGRRTNQRWGFQEEGTEAATWDQRGIFLAVVFEADPSAKTPYYKDAADFHRQTGNRFRREWHDMEAASDVLVLSQSSPDYKITAHRWTPDFEANRPLSGYLSLRCKGHSAARNMRAECHAVLVQ